MWICPTDRGHIQATGRDDKGRKQYRYHAAFREVRDSAKYEHVTAFAEALPTIRATVKRHMALRGLPRQKVLATVVYLLETTLIRVGNEGYAKHNQSYGLTTLEDRHVDAHGADLRFAFKGKSNKMWNLKVHDRRVATIVKACHDLPGQHLFQYLDHDGHTHSVSSHDVNEYLREITGRDVSAKDFRTWAGTVLAALALHEFGTIDTEAKAKKNVRAAIERVSARLGNTPTICRKCYVHPAVVNSYMSGRPAAGDQGGGRRGAARRPAEAEARGGRRADAAGAPHRPRAGGEEAEKAEAERARRQGPAEAPRKAEDGGVSRPGAPGAHTPRCSPISRATSAGRSSGSRWPAPSSTSSRWCAKCGAMWRRWASGPSAASFEPARISAGVRSTPIRSAQSSRLPRSSQATQASRSIRATSPAACSSTSASSGAGGVARHVGARLRAGARRRRPRTSPACRRGRPRPSARGRGASRRRGRSAPARRGPGAPSSAIRATAQDTLPPMLWPATAQRRGACSRTTRRHGLGHLGDGEALLGVGVAEARQVDRHAAGPAGEARRDPGPLVAGGGQEGQQDQGGASVEGHGVLAVRRGGHRGRVGAALWGRDGPGRPGEAASTPRSGRTGRGSARGNAPLPPPRKP